MQVTIFGKPNCGFCEKAKFLCEMKGIEYRYLSLGTDCTIEELTEQVGFAPRSVPQIFVDDKHIGGYDALKKQLG